MTEKNNATCSICGSKYYACFSCKEAMSLHPWKIHCCSSNCYKVYQAVRGLSTEVYTKDEFKSQLKNIDLSNLENYREHIKAIIKDALKEDKPVVKNVVNDVKTDEAVVIEKPTYSRKRNYKTELE